ncbi:hypothetical protein P9E76_08970 [Schinkia azotoformans]|uniref:Uncharacterized protein n=1 Tax=Schinkia azotoformans LMG 9581 TaxID=1131731 RepID=K6DKR7_SCHAZ|nr:hypothetical protein [Schinkia azotoformans]EKN68743.1 hypothetical protein BAZO_03156 [Schinkia azotoformans LMG 9581]MEC1639068.1 hypothetical protein [Schinkia azotoformans]MEC1945174.1 hypothetical protein [Schinkia azotoformans]MED4354026.1 hypothetical protein [Schinkia azotoformans]
MYKTITLRVSEEELQKIESLREQHFQKFHAPISQSQLIRNLIHEKCKEPDNIAGVKEKADLFTEKEIAHKRDITIVDRLRERRWSRAKD